MRPARTLAVTVAVYAATWAWRAPPRANGQHAPIKDRDYAIDLPQSVVLGSIRVVGMAGAATSLAEGSVGMLANPAAPAVRPATSSDTWDWHWHIDWLSPGLGSDFDNSGTVTDEEQVVAPLLTSGLVVQYKNWAVGLSANVSKRHLTLDADNALEPSFAVGRLIVARSWRDATVGLGVRGGTFTMTAQRSSGISDDRTTVATKLFELSGTGLEAGAIWHPRDRFWSFCCAGDRYRARMSFTADVARQYGNTGVSIGLWH